MDAAQGAKAAQGLFFPGLAGGKHPLELDEALARLRPGLALEMLGHHRGGGLGNGAAGALKAHVANDVLVKLEKDGEVIAAKRVVALGAAAGVREGAEIARVAVVIKNHFLVKIVQVVAHGAVWRRSVKAGCLPFGSFPPTAGFD